jgi:hypothetical protein
MKGKAMKIPKQQYTAEFKELAVTRVRDGQSAGAVDKELGLWDQALPDLIAAGEANDVALVYSQAAIEHIWHVADFWRAIIGVTKPGGCTAIA